MLLEQVLLILLLLLREKLLLCSQEALLFLLFTLLFLAHKGFEVQKDVVFVFGQSLQRFFQFFHVLNGGDMFLFELFADIFSTAKATCLENQIGFFLSSIRFGWIESSCGKIRFSQRMLFFQLDCVR